MKERRILLITNIPTPYRIPLFNELDRQLGEHDLGLTVLFAASGYARRQWRLDMSQCRFEHEVLHSKKIAAIRSENTIFTYSGLYRRIKAIDPAVIIVNAFSLATMKVWWRSWFTRSRYLIWSGSIPGSRVNWARRVQRRILVKRASGFVSYGSLAKDYLVGLGAEPAKIHIGINTVDTQFFKSETDRLRQGLSHSSEKKVLLCLNRLERRKRIDQLLLTVSKLARKRNDVTLEIVGHGPQRDELQLMTQNLGISHLVVFVGFKQKEEIPVHLARADCFLFPTDGDVWGLVLVEAMAAGLPCLSSIHAGATRDLIQDGVTGFAIDFSQTEKVAERLEWILDHPREAQSMGDAARRYVEENVCIKKSAAGFTSAILQAMEKS